MGRGRRQRHAWDHLSDQARAEEELLRLRHLQDMEVRLSAVRVDEGVDGGWGEEAGMSQRGAQSGLNHTKPSQTPRFD